jgi:hypothetical protein
MLHLALRRNSVDAVIEIRNPTAAARFQRVLAILKLEYNLDPDVLAEAERLLQILKARELH